MDIALKSNSFLDFRNWLQNVLQCHDGRKTYVRYNKIVFDFKIPLRKNFQFRLFLYERYLDLNS